MWITRILVLEIKLPISQSAVKSRKKSAGIKKRGDDANSKNPSNLLISKHADTGKRKLAIREILQIQKSAITYEQAVRGLFTTGTSGRLIK
jgi:hypothetical protein